MKQKTEAIIRLIVALLPLVNMVLISFDMSPLPFESDELNAALTSIAEALALLWAWWKNNNITFEAQLAQKTLDKLKHDKDKIGGEGDPLEVQ